MEVKCPKCGGQTSLRTRSKDKRKFYVCIRYPECKGKIEGSLDDDSDSRVEVENDVPGEERPDDKQSGNAKGVGAEKLFFILGGIFSGAILIIAGIKMLSIQSVSSATGEGGTIHEAYYHAMGFGFIGLGIFAAALLIGMGWKRS